METFFLHESIFLIFAFTPRGDKAEGFCEGKGDVKICSCSERSVTVRAVPDSAETQTAGFTGGETWRKARECLERCWS
jgi:hypothetical protein